MGRCVRASNGAQCMGVQLPRQSTCVVHTSKAAILVAFAALSRTCDGDHKELFNYGAFIVDGDAWAWVALPVKAADFPEPIPMTHCFLCGGRLSMEAPDA